MLLLLRHAVTGWNEEGRIQGRQDVPLSDLGRRQALAWRLPAGARSYRWYASPLSRAAETARQMGLHALPEPRLAEMAWGDWEGCRLADLRASGALTEDQEALGLDFRPPGGESPRDVQIRVLTWLKDLSARSGSFGAVTHNGVIRAVYALAVGWDMKAKPPVKLNDGCAQIFRLGKDGWPALEAANVPL